MKYFTAELLDRFGSDDPAVYKPAAAEWEEKCEQYNAYLDALKSDLPVDVRLIEEKYYLHDALICGMGQSDRAFVVLLQLDTPPRSLLSLSYDLLEEAIILQGTNEANGDFSNAHVEWQYDEIERIAAEPPAWLQSILLSNGWEIRLRFRNVQVRESQAVLPVPLDATNRAPAPAQSAEMMTEAP